MIDIDSFAYTSKLISINPMEKFLFGILTMFSCLYCNSIYISMFLIILMGFITVRKGGIPFFFYLKLMLLPFSFLIIAVITIAINVVDGSSGILFSFKILGGNIGATNTSVLLALGLILKSLAAVSCLYFLSLSTPMTDILYVLKRLRVPKLIVELMHLIYRFIFIMLNSMQMIVTAQTSRLGYSNSTRAFRSSAQLIASIFIKSYTRSQDIYSALEARGYEGEINVLEEEHKYKADNIFLIILFQVTLFITINFLKN
jgi:cobalt/nickel transport system permease protein